MKTILLLSSILISCFLSAQDIVFKSIELDSLIWQKINEYRISKNVKPFESFEYAEIRAYSYDLTYNNSKLNTIKHSGDAFDIYNVECIYALQRTSPENFLNDIENKNWEYLANRVVSAWIKSSAHEKGISSDQFTKATVTSIITIDSNTGNYRFDVSYHAIY